MMKIIGRMTLSAVSLFLISSFFLSSPCMAQTPPNVPTADEPGRQAARFQQETEAQRDAVEKKKPKAPEIEVQEAEKKPVEGGPSFVLKDVSVTGSTLFKPEYFKPFYEPYLDKKVAWQDIEAITEKIKAEYKKRGYLTTNVYVPEQDVAGGKIEIRILEGRLGELKIEGNKWFTDKLIKKYFHAKKNELLNIFTLSKDLLRLNQNSDLDIKAITGEGSEPGYSNITLKVKDKFPYHAGSAYDNQGTRIVGKPRTSISFRSTNLSGQNDSLFFNTIESAMSQGNSISYLYPIDTYGTKAGLDVVIFDTKLGREYKEFNITSNSQIYTPKILSEMYLTEDFQINTAAGMEIKSIKKLVNGEKSTDDQLRIPFVDLDFVKLDPFFGGGQTSLSSRFIFSTDSFLGASKHNHAAASRPSTGGFFFKYEQSLSRVQRMPFDSYLFIKTEFQNATHTLPSSEQIGFGGAYSIRGYPEGDYAADYGASLNMDWVFPLPFVPKDFKLPYSPTPFRHQIEPVVFMDMGGGKLKKFGSSERETKFLMGLGGGLKVQINKNLFLRLYWAERVGDRPSAGSAPSNFHISFQGEI